MSIHRGACTAVLNISFDTDPGGVVCEVQLIHQKLMLARKGMAGHKDYVAYRSSVELQEAVAAKTKSFSRPDVVHMGNGWTTMGM